MRRRTRRSGQSNRQSWGGICHLEERYLRFRNQYGRILRHGRLEGVACAWRRSQCLGEASTMIPRVRDTKEYGRELGERQGDGNNDREKTATFACFPACFQVGFNQVKKGSVGRNFK
ncbi:hypothetical protein Hanom_Chr12g01172771 [Helianthus anomalus]